MKTRLFALAVTSLLGSVASLAAATDSPDAIPQPSATLAAPATPPALPAPAAPAAIPTPSAATPAPMGAKVFKPAEPTEKSRVADRAAYFEARLAGLHAGLTLNTDQEHLWPALERAVRDLASLHGAPRQADAVALKDDVVAQANAEVSGSADKPFAALRRTGERLERNGKALQALADAAKPMFASLDQDQKSRLPYLLRGLAPKRGPVAQLLRQIEPDRADQADDNEMDQPRRGMGEGEGSRGDRAFQRQGSTEEYDGSSDPRRGGRLERGDRYRGYDETPRQRDGMAEGDTGDRDSRDGSGAY